MANVSLVAAKMPAVRPVAPLPCPSPVERSPVGFCRLPTRRPGCRGRGTGRLSIESSAAAATPATHADAEAVLKSVQELPDGSIVLHYDTDGKTREVSRDVYAFLTRTSRSSGQVSSEVLQQLLGENVQVHMHLPHPASGIASFVKGVLQAEQNGNPTEGAPTQATPARIATPPHQLVENGLAIPDVPPAEDVSQGAASMSSSPLPAGGGATEAGFSLGRTLAVLVVSGVATAAARVAAASNEAAQSLLGKSPVLVTGTAFVALALLLWIVGFGKSDHLDGKVPQTA